MKTLWNKGLDAEKKAEVKKDFEAAALLRSRLKLLLDEKIESSRTKARSSNTYDSPSWALTQADSIGYERALFEVISLLE